MIIFSFNHFLLVDFGLIMDEKWSAIIWIEKNNTKQKSGEKYIRMKMDFAIFYD